MGHTATSVDTQQHRYGTHSKHIVDKRRNLIGDKDISFVYLMCLIRFLDKLLNPFVAQSSRNEEKTCHYPSISQLSPMLHLKLWKTIDIFIYIHSSSAFETSSNHSFIPLARIVFHSCMQRSEAVQTHKHILHQQLLHIHVFP